MVNKPEELKKRLKKKGFKEEDVVDGHDAYVFRNPETGRYVYTYFSRGSHGKRALSEHLLHEMSQQLGFKKGEYNLFQQMVECKIKGSEYKKMMVRRGVLNTKPRRRGRRI